MRPCLRILRRFLKPIFVSEARCGLGWRTAGLDRQSVNLKRKAAVRNGCSTLVYSDIFCAFRGSSTFTRTLPVRRSCMRPDLTFMYFLRTSFSVSILASIPSTYLEMAVCSGLSGSGHLRDPIVGRLRLAFAPESFSLLNCSCPRGVVKNLPTHFGSISILASLTIAMC